MSTTEHGSGPEFSKFGSADSDPSSAGLQNSGQQSTTDPWVEAQASPDFRELRKRLRGFVFPMTALFLAWYLAYVLLASYAGDFMATRVADSNITVGLIIGLLQFVTTFVITTIYVAFANKRLDPLAETVRERVEGGMA